MPDIVVPSKLLAEGDFVLSSGRCFRCNMASSRLLNLSRLLTSPTHLARISVRNVTCDKAGGILPKPEGRRFGLLKVAVIVTPFLFVGGILSREGAALLEDNDIFSPEEDD